jgi:hypothetical protein
VKFDDLFNTSLARFHEDCPGLDYLRLDLSADEFDWSQFFKKFHENLVYESIGSPKLVKDETTNNIRRLEFLFHIKDLSFLGIADVISCNDDIFRLQKNSIKDDRRQIKTSRLKELIKLYEHNPDKMVVKFQFKDDTGNMSISNRAGNLAFAVLKVASETLSYAFMKVGWDNVFAFEFHVDKNESKRLELYKKLLARNDIMRDNFKNQYTDATSDADYITFYAWR